MKTSTGINTSKEDDQNSDSKNDPINEYFNALKSKINLFSKKYFNGKYYSQNKFKSSKSLSLRRKCFKKNKYNCKWYPKKFKLRKNNSYIVLNKDVIIEIDKIDKEMTDLNKCFARKSGINSSNSSIISQESQSLKKKKHNKSKLSNLKEEESYLETDKKISEIKTEDEEKKDISLPIKLTIEIVPDNDLNVKSKSKSKVTIDKSVLSLHNKYIESPLSKSNLSRNDSKKSILSSKSKKTIEFIDDKKHEKLILNLKNLDTFEVEKKINFKQQRRYSTCFDNKYMKLVVLLFRLLLKCVCI